ncbi:adenylate/guanylate cyclase with integral membrane sensor [Pelomyxa schiedti]|nr:adenylate/guanylate cyclase with integral membrane sensor [Pelomyxa schiedti]
MPTRRSSAVRPVDENDKEEASIPDPKRRSVPLSCILIFVICVAVWAPTCVAIVMQAVTYNQQVRQSSGELSKSSITGVYTGVLNTFMEAETMTRSFAQMFESKTLNMDNLNYTIGVSLDFLRGFNISTSVWLTTKQGGLYGTWVDSVGFGSWWWKDGTQYRYKIDGLGHVISLIDTVTPVNNTEGEWYTILSPEKDSKSWTEPYIYQDGTLVSFSHAAFQDNEFIGVVGVDFSLSMTDRVLHSFSMETAIVLLADSDQSVYGTTDSSIALSKLTTEGFEIPIDISDIELPKVKEANEIVVRRYGTWLNASKNGFAQWMTPTVFATAVPLSRPGLDWVIIVIDQPVFDNADWKFPVVSIIMTIVFVALTVVLVNYQVSKPLSSVNQAMKAVVGLDFSLAPQLSRVSEINGIINTFSSLRTGVAMMTKYVPKPLVKEILTSNVTDLLTMKPAHLTIMFCDIQGFSGISESYSKGVVAEILKSWFGCFSDVIMKHSGCIDKYIGDCIMAIWGAPEPLETSEIEACMSAIEFGSALASLNASFPSKYPQLKTRVGIHSGNLLVGNIGYEQRINYTVCGNVANLSARLEQAGKVYGVSPLISGQIYKAVKSSFVCVWLDAVVLRGYRTRITHVYHLVAKKGEATPDESRAEEIMAGLKASLKKRDYAAATESISQHETEACMEQYGAALAILDEHCIQQDFLKVDDSFTTRGRRNIASADKLSLSTDLRSSTSASSRTTTAATSPPPVVDFT